MEKAIKNSDYFKYYREKGSKVPFEDEEAFKNYLCAEKNEKEACSLQTKLLKKLKDRIKKLSTDTEVDEEINPVAKVKDPFDDFEQFYDLKPTGDERKGLVVIFSYPGIKKNWLSSDNAIEKDIDGSAMYLLFEKMFDKGTVQNLKYLIVLF